MSETEYRHNYEGMFLFGQATATNLAGCVAHVKEILDRGEAEIIAIKKWDERRFAYEISKQKRGTYLLVYFSAPAQGLTEIERACNLSETLLRQLIIRADHLTEDEMRAADAQEDLHLEAMLKAADEPQPEAEAAPGAETPAAEPQPAGDAG